MFLIKSLPILLWWYTGLVNLKIIGWALEKLYLLSWLIVECSCFEIHRMELMNNDIHEAIQFIISSLEKQGQAPGTLKNYINSFHVFEQYLEENSICEVNERICLEYIQFKTGKKINSFRGTTLDPNLNRRMKRTVPFLGILILGSRSERSWLVKPWKNKKCPNAQGTPPVHGQGRTGHGTPGTPWNAFPQEHPCQEHVGFRRSAPGHLRNAWAPEHQYNRNLSENRSGKPEAAYVTDPQSQPGDHQQDRIIPFPFWVFSVNSRQEFFDLIFFPGIGDRPIPWYPDFGIWAKKAGTAFPMPIRLSWDLPVLWGIL